MKNKKFLTMISSVVMAAALSVSAIAGCKKGDGHVHAPNWTTDYEATCTTPGHRTGTCVCGDVVAEVIPVDPDAHDYDEWEIDEYPSESSAGSAVRVCKRDSSHVVRATLPKLTESGEGYVSSETVKNPTIISTGVRHFVYAHSAGNVEFDVTLPKRSGVENIEDAVLLGSSLHNLVRKSEGSYYEGDPDGSGTVLANEFFNYYGDNDSYVRVHDGGNRRDFWYSRDEDGKPFGISAEVKRVIANEPADPDNPPAGWKPIFEDIKSDPQVVENVTEQNLLGFGYLSGGGMSATYGVEDTLLNYYQAYLSAGAIKRDSSVTKNATTGEYDCSFGFSRFEQPHFCRYYVEFTLFENGAIKNISLKTKIIRQFMLANSFDGTNVGEVIFDGDGDIIFSEIYPINTATGEDEYEVEYEKDENGNIVYDIRYKVDENGEFVLDGNGEKIIESQTPIVKSILVEGVKQKPDGSNLLDASGNEVKRPVPLGWHEGDAREYYYEKGDKKYDGTDDVYEEDHPYIAIRVLRAEQTLKVAGEEVEENPYSAESVYIRSFDVSYGNKVIGEDEVINISANTGVLFKISNVQPAETAKLDYDPIRVFLKTPAGGEVKLSYTGEVPNFNENAYHIVGYFRSDLNSVYINAQYAGELTLILRTLSGRCERQLKLNIAKGAPSKLLAETYAYSDAGGIVTYTWTEFDNTVAGNFIELYAGQTLYVRAAALPSEENYADTSFTTSATTLSDCVALQDNVKINESDENYVSKITALSPTAEGKYAVVYVESTIKNNGIPVADAKIQIKVVPVPSVDDMFTGEYTGRFAKIKMVETDSTPKPANVKLTISPDDGDNSHGTINIEVTGSNITAKCVYSYSYNAETHKLECEYVSGRNDKTFQFEIALNERYKLSITHPQGILERTETIVLSRSES